MSKKSLTVFFSYSHKDELLRDELAKHLSLLQRDGTISAWHDRQISAGTEWANDIDSNLNAADLILLLISSDFLASDYCHQVELKRAIERHEKGEALVIPIILRPCVWTRAVFSKLQSLPKNGEPVTKWLDRDDAFTNIVEGIEKAIGEFSAIDYRELEKLLKAQEWRSADELTAKLMLKASNRESQGWLDEESIKIFPCEDLRTIDQLWVHYSNSKFGFSIQKKLWLECGGEIGKYDYEVWKKFGEKVGWYHPKHDKWRTYTKFMNDTKNAQNSLPASLPFRRRSPLGVLFEGVVLGELGWVLFSRAESCEL